MANRRPMRAAADYTCPRCETSQRPVKVDERPDGRPVLQCKAIAFGPSHIVCGLITVPLLSLIPTP